MNLVAGCLQLNPRTLMPDNGHKQYQFYPCPNSFSNMTNMVQSNLSHYGLPTTGFSGHSVGHPDVTGAGYCSASPVPEAAAMPQGTMTSHYYGNHQQQHHHHHQQQQQQQQQHHSHVPLATTSSYQQDSPGLPQMYNNSPVKQEISTSHPHPHGAYTVSPQIPESFNDSGVDGLLEDPYSADPAHPDPLTLPQQPEAVVSAMTSSPIMTSSYSY